MRKISILVLCLASISGSAQLNKALEEAAKVVSAKSINGPTTDEVAAGLKEALTKGISAGADKVSVVDGYFKNPQIKIPFPPDVKRVEDRLRQIGMGAQVDKFVETMNHGAENAAQESKPIFINAIKQMTIADAWGILKGQPDAATQYLQRTTTPDLKVKFKPVMQASLDKVSATKYYGDIVTTYNKIPLVKKVNPDLNEYATDMALKGLFTMIAIEEKKIRDNPLERTTDLLKKVFSFQK